MLTLLSQIKGLRLAKDGFGLGESFVGPPVVGIGRVNYPYFTTSLWYLFQVFRFERTNNTYSRCCR